MALIDTIKDISRASQGVQAGVMYGEVKKNNPLTVSVDSRLELDGDLLVIPEHVGGLAKGDTVALLRNQGGQEFIVLGKVKKRE